MTSAEAKHRELTAQRIQAYLKLFGANPAKIYSSVRFSDIETDRFPIDVIVFTIDPEVPIVAAITNGLSNQRMIDPKNSSIGFRREVIQYFPICTEEHARRLRDMAWVPLFDGFLIDSHHSMEWKFPAIEGTPWKNAFYLEPIIRSHRDFRFEIEDDMVSLLWHIPVSDREREYNLRHGSNALIDRMGAVQLPWVFDEKNRPPLVSELDK